MKIKLAYGRSGLEVEFPDAQVEVIEPRFIEGLPAGRRLCARLCASRSARVPCGTGQAGDSVAVIFSDRTRPT
jgi:hypothetical protein